jgi:hypothetical protein
LYLEKRTSYEAPQFRDITEKGKIGGDAHRGR